MLDDPLRRKMHVGFVATVSESQGPARMLDFRRRHRAPNYLGSGLERRLLSLVAASGLVVLLILGAGDPRHWRWLLPDARHDARQQRVERVAEPMVVASDKQRASAPAPDDDLAGAPPAGAADVQATSRDVGRFFPGVRGDYLGAVRDDTVFRPAESDAWFHLGALLARTDNEKLVAAAEGPVSYVQLQEQPKAYRGHLVTVRGVARGAKRVAAAENAFDVQQYYQLWIQPDRAASDLIALYCLELPEGFPLGEPIDAECAATGFFFKRWAYESRGGIATAPLVVARTLDWQPPAVEGQRPAAPAGEQFLMALVAALVLAAVVLGFVIWRGRTTMRRRAGASGATHDADRVGAILASLDAELARPPTDASGKRDVDPT